MQLGFRSRLIVLVTTALLITGCTCSLSVQSYVVSPPYVGSITAQFQFNLSLSAFNLSPSYSLGFLFPSKIFKLSAVSDCSATIDGSASPTSLSCNITSTNQVQFYNLTTKTIAPSLAAIKFRTNTALFESTPSINVFLLDEFGNYINGYYISYTMSFTSAPLLNCAVTSTSAVAGQTANWTFSFTPTTPILSGYLFDVQIPLWTASRPSRFTNQTPGCTGGSCTTGMNSTIETLSFKLLFNSSVSTQVTATVYDILNTNTTDAITLTYLIRTSQTYLSQKGTTNLTMAYPPIPTYIYTLYERMAYFPFLIVTVVLVLCIFVVKLARPNTSLMPNLVTVCSLPQLACTIYFIVYLFKDPDIFSKLLISVFAVGSVVVQILLNIGFCILNVDTLAKDPYFRIWINHSPNHYFWYFVVSAVSLVNFKFFRVLYGRFADFLPFSLVCKDREMLFKFIGICSITACMLVQLPELVASILTQQWKPIKDSQLYFTAIQLIILSLNGLVLSLADLYKIEEYFYFSKFVEFLPEQELAEKSNTLSKINNIFSSSLRSPGGSKSLDPKSPINFEPDSTAEININEDTLDQGAASAKKQIKQAAASSSPNSLKSSPVQAKAQSEKKKKSSRRNKRRINILEAVEEQDAEYCTDSSMSSDEEALNSSRRKLKSQERDSPEQRDQDFDMNQPLTQNMNWDTRSLVESPILKRRWIQIVQQRREEARRMQQERERLEQGLAEPSHRSKDSDEMQDFQDLPIIQEVETFVEPGKLAKKLARFREAKQQDERLKHIYSQKLSTLVQDTSNLNRRLAARQIRRVSDPKTISPGTSKSTRHMTTTKTEQLLVSKDTRNVNTSLGQRRSSKRTRISDIDLDF